MGAIETWLTNIKVIIHTENDGPRCLSERLVAMGAKSAQTNAPDTRIMGFYCVGRNPYIQDLRVESDMAGRMSQDW